MFDLGKATSETKAVIQPGVLPDSQFGPNRLYSVKP